jgi:hypothetical protein
MLHARSQVLFEEIDNAGSRWRMLSHEQVARLAQRRQRHVRRAA